MTLGLDISTSCIGIALFDENDELKELSYVQFSDKQKNMFEKLEFFKKNILHLKDKGVKYIAIEEPLKKFMGKFSNANTISMLNFFNGMISSCCYELFSIEPAYYNVNSARSTVFDGFHKDIKEKDHKNEVWRRVASMEPHINWEYGPKSGKLKEYCFDMADAYTVGVADIITRRKQMES